MSANSYSTEIYNTFEAHGQSNWSPPTHFAQNASNSFYSSSSTTSSSMMMDIEPTSASSMLWSVTTLPSRNDNADDAESSFAIKSAVNGENYDGIKQSPVWFVFDRVNSSSDSINAAAKVAIGILFSICIIITVVGNLLIVLAVATNRRLKRLGNVFIASLAIADLAVGLLVMPFALLNDLLGYWPLPIVMCELWLSFDVLGSTASILNLCAISLDRFICIRNSLDYAARVTVRKVIIAVVVIWTLSALISFLPFQLGLQNWTPYRSSSSSENKTFDLFDPIDSAFPPTIGSSIKHMPISDFFPAESQIHENLVTNYPSVLTHNIVDNLHGGYSSKRQLFLPLPPKPRNISFYSFSKTPPTTTSYYSSSTARDVFMPFPPSTPNSQYYYDTASSTEDYYSTSTIDLSLSPDYNRFPEQVYYHQILPGSPTAEMQSATPVSNVWKQRQEEKKTGRRLKRFADIIDSRQKKSNTQNFGVSETSVFSMPIDNKTPDDQFSSSPSLQQCFLDISFAYALASSTISFYIPCIVMLLIYHQLFREARKHVRAIRKYERVVAHSFSTETSVCSSSNTLTTAHAAALPSSSSSSVVPPMVSSVSEHKAAVTLGVIMGTFLLCWLPFFIINPIAAGCSDECISRVTFKALTWLGYCNSSLNPIIYSIFNQASNLFANDSSGFLQF